MTELAVLTMEELRALVVGTNYAAKIRDIDGVRPDSRGTTVEFTFTGLSPVYTLGEPIPSFGYSDHPNDWMVDGTSLPTAPRKAIYRLHAWLIEEITPS